LPQIACPTLVIAGAADTITPPDGMQAMHAMIPGSRYVVIPGAGHLTPIEQPATFATALRECVSELH
jgi:3-oxoadipate enol-lactonase